MTKYGGRIVSKLQGTYVTKKRCIETPSYPTPNSICNSGIEIQLLESMKNREMVAAVHREPHLSTKKPDATEAFKRKLKKSYKESIQDNTMERGEGQYDAKIEDVHGCRNTSKEPETQSNT